MSETIGHECGIAALYWLKKSAARGGRASRLVKSGNITSFLPAMLMDLQNRGQLAAGISTYNPKRSQIVDTYKGVGTVSEVFRMSRPDKYQSIMDEYAGMAGIGHTRYATCGADDDRYAQPFERHHGRLWKWFSFAFNGTLANFTDLRKQLLAKRNYHCSLDTDTEIIMHSLSYRLRGDVEPDLRLTMRRMADQFDGAYNLAFLDAQGRMFVARDPLGIRPLCWAVEGRLFAASSESVALSNMGFKKINHMEPGQMAIIEDGCLRIERFVDPVTPARCFFEWIYFANVASIIDDSDVYGCRTATGHALAKAETIPVDENSIVVGVPDTAKAAAASFAFELGIPCEEGIMRNRYVGRTFIQPDAARQISVWSKYTPLPSVLAGKRVFLVEDSIVRATTLRRLVRQLRELGKAAEVHVRVACPPIVAPCFYGIDMSTLGELFAPKYVRPRYDGNPNEAELEQMANKLGLDSLRYLNVSDLGPCLGCSNETLCLGCVTGRYPTLCGKKLFRRAKTHLKKGKTGRVYG